MRPKHTGNDVLPELGSRLVHTIELELSAVVARNRRERCVLRLRRYVVQRALLKDGRSRLVRVCLGDERTQDRAGEEEDREETHAGMGGGSKKTGVGRLLYVLRRRDLE